MRLYHTTTRERAEEIRVNGFDGALDCQYIKAPVQACALFSYVPRDSSDGLPPTFTSVLRVNFPDNILPQYVIREAPSDASHSPEHSDPTGDVAIPAEIANKYFSDRTIYDADSIEQADDVLRNRRRVQADLLVFQGIFPDADKGE